jgi:hypothetical protein
LLAAWKHDFFFGFLYLQKSIQIALNNFPEQRYVEFLLDSVRCLLAVRIAHRGEKNAVEWCYFDGKTYKPRHIIGRA